MSLTDVNILDITTNNDDFKVGAAITFEVTAEVGQALFDNGGKYEVRMTLTDTTNPALLNAQAIIGYYGDANWRNSGRNTFTFTVPAGVTAGRLGSLLEPQAMLVGGAQGARDTSHAVGERILLTP